jgi:hypothetical protein
MTKFQLIIYRITFKIFSKILAIFSLPDPITIHRIMLSKKIQKDMGDTVRHGYFKGMKLPTVMSWGESDRVSMLLGYYESEVLEAIYSSPTKYDTFIDLGAADGYYAIGGLISNRFKNAICYEMSLERQLVLKTNANSNNVSNSIEIRGAADASFIDDKVEKLLDKAVVLIDIEGAEFDLLTDRILGKLSKSIVIIELHDHLVANGKHKLDELTSKVHNIFEVNLIDTGSRDPSQYDELRNFSDNDKWLVCSEGRKRSGSWMHLTPLDHNVNP